MVAGNQILWKPWGLVGQATTVYECDLTGQDPKNQLVKLSWPEATRTPELEILKKLEGILDEGVVGHIPQLLGFQTPAAMNTQDIRKCRATASLR